MAPRSPPRGVSPPKMLKYSYTSRLWGPEKRRKRPKRDPSWPSWVQVGPKLGPRWHQINPKLPCNIDPPFKNTKRVGKAGGTALIFLGKKRATSQAHTEGEGEGEGEGENNKEESQDAFSGAKQDPRRSELQGWSPISARVGGAARGPRACGLAAVTRASPAHAPAHTNMWRRPTHASPAHARAHTNLCVSSPTRIRPCVCTFAKSRPKSHSGGWTR